MINTKETPREIMERTFITDRLLPFYFLIFAFSGIGRVKQLVGLFAERLAEGLVVEGLDCGVLV